MAEPPRINTKVPHPARVYDSACPREPTLVLGGKDNFEAEGPTSLWGGVARKP